MVGICHFSQREGLSCLACSAGGLAAHEEREQQAHAHGADAAAGRAAGPVCGG